MKAARDLFIHLRLHYQLVFLSPLFLWGVLLGGGPDRASILPGFIAFHVFLYGGITAYNSYYDRDEGPVGGLRRPPAVTDTLLGFSLAMQLVGLGLALHVGVPFAAGYVAVMALSIAYSHPRFRWKGRPLLSLAVVGLGQGGIAFAGGWLCSVSDAAALASGRALLGTAVAVLSAVGLYPLTQVYQIEEDRGRGDRTFAVAYGAPACFRFAMGALGATGGCMIPLVDSAFGHWDAIVASVLFAGAIAFIARWAATYRDAVEDNFRILHRLQLVMSLGTLGYLATRLALVGAGAPN